MAMSLSSSAKLLFDWAWSDALDLSSVIDTAEASEELTYANGTGALQNKVVWHDQRQVAGPAGTADNIDLVSITQTFFGKSIPLALAAIKIIMIVNTNTTAGDDLYIDSSTANSFVGPFADSATSKIEIPAESMIIWAANISGWAPAAGTGDILSIKNDSSNAITYKIVIVGDEG